MGHSEDYIRNKMYELEKQKVELEEKKLKALIDTRDAILVADTLMLADMGKKLIPTKSLQFTTLVKNLWTEFSNRLIRGGQNEF